MPLSGLHFYSWIQNHHNNIIIRKLIGKFDLFAVHVEDITHQTNGIGWHMRCNCLCVSPADSKSEVTDPFDSKNWKTFSFSRFPLEESHYAFWSSRVCSNTHHTCSTMWLNHGWGGSSCCKVWHVLPTIQRTTASRKNPLTRKNIVLKAIPSFTESWVTSSSCFTNHCVQLPLVYNGLRV